MKKKLLPFLAVALTAMPLSAETLDWNKIEHWAGEGPNRAALVVQFITGDGQTNPGAVVWGYRWADGETPTCYDLVTAVAKASSDLVVLTQFTGPMGCTMNGIGYAKDINVLLDNLEYDFDSAMQYPKISFGFDEPNTSMGQTSAPGNETLNLVLEAIDDARETHNIDHPLNQRVYGYPAYDYDWWQLGAQKPDMYWNAGWYKSYWSYWLGGSDMNSLSYSGLGMSSVELMDGDVHGWKHLPINEDDMNQDFDQYLEDNSSWLTLNYNHFSGTSGIASSEFAEDAAVEYYRLDGTRATGTLPAGIYLRRQGTHTSKIIIK